jgi:uncharacterized protein
MNSSFLDQLNLTPQERRIVVVIAVIVFVVLNLLLVWPHFKDLGRVRGELEQTRKTIIKDNNAILKDNDPKDGYKKELAQLQRQQGGGVMDHQIQLQKTISDQAIKSGVNVSDTRPAGAVSAETNAFYDEQDVRITFESEESQLITFLYNIGNDPAMIRVSELNLRPADANRYRLKGDALLSANYARKAPVTASTSAAPGAKPAPVVTPKPPGNLPIPGHTPLANPKNAPGQPFPRKNL